VHTPDRRVTTLQRLLWFMQLGEIGPARIVERQDKSSFGEPDLHETTVLVEDLRT
jgi:hypothetical protein